MTDQPGPHPSYAPATERGISPPLTINDIPFDDRLWRILVDAAAAIERGEATAARQILHEMDELPTNRMAGVYAALLAAQLICQHLGSGARPTAEALLQFCDETYPRFSTMVRNYSLDNLQMAICEALGYSGFGVDVRAGDLVVIYLCITAILQSDLGIDPNSLRDVVARAYSQSVRRELAKSALQRD